MGLGSALGAAAGNDLVDDANHEHGVRFRTLALLKVELSLNRQFALNMLGAFQVSHQSRDIGVGGLAIE